MSHARDLPLGARPRRGLPVVDATRRGPKLSEAIAGEIVRSIVAGSLQVGDHLASEALMVEHYGVGRESLREALRLLEWQGLITIKRGPGGGPVVSGIDPRYLARTTSLFLHLGGATYDEMLEAWQVFEPALAFRAATQHARDDVARTLGAYLWPTGDERARGEVADHGFHTALARLSGNRVTVLLLRAMSHLVADADADADTDPEASLCHLGGGGQDEREHVAIARAVFDGRAAVAQRLTEQHIGKVRAGCARRWPERVLGLVEWS